MLDMTQSTQTRLLTADEFWDFVDSIKDDTKRFELIYGEIIEMPSASPIHNYIVSFLTTLLFTFGRSTNLGYGFGDGCTYQLADNLIFIPDASFISKSKTQKPFPKRFLFAPDLAVEIVSPSNTYKEILFKTESYLRHGTKMVWVIYPDDELVDVWRMMPDGSLNKRAFKKGDSLSGEDVLPNFTLPIGDIFNL